MRTSVTAFSKESSNCVFGEGPLPGRKWTSMTFVLGGKRMPSGGYTRVGLHEALLVAPALPNAPGALPASPTPPSPPPGPNVAVSLRLSVVDPVTPHVFASTVTCPPSTPAHVNVAPLKVPIELLESERNDCVVTSAV